MRGLRALLREPWRPTKRPRRPCCCCCCLPPRRHQSAIVGVRSSRRQLQRARPPRPCWRGAGTAARSSSDRWWRVASARAREGCRGCSNTALAKEPAKRSTRFSPFLARSDHRRGGTKTRKGAILAKHPRLQGETASAVSPRARGVLRGRGRAGGDFWDTPFSSRCAAAWAAAVASARLSMSLRHSHWISRTWLHWSSTTRRASSARHQRCHCQESLSRCFMPGAPQTLLLRDRRALRTWRPTSPTTAPTWWPSCGRSLSHHPPMHLSLAADPIPRMRSRRRATCLIGRPAPRPSEQQQAHRRRPRPRHRIPPPRSRRRPPHRTAPTCPT